jgi:transglutaminase 1
MAFRITRYDLHIRETGRAHHTDDYANDNWVIRRGGSFEVSFNCNGFDADRSRLQIHLRGGRNPNRRNGTWIVIDDTPDDDDYYFKVESKSATHVKIRVFVPVDALVSAYDFSIMDMATRKEYPADRKLYILFNPWHEKDDVYMADEKLREEYVLNDSGYVFTNGHRATRWTFGQFTDVALKCTFKLLEMCRRVSDRDTAREVVRHISSAANNADNNGLVAGKWLTRPGMNFDGGRRPGEWTGSTAIFRQYLETGAPVKWGQCWVFSAVTTSMMRCLGIPCRSVTNYESAHDTDGNCTDDKYYDENYDYMAAESYDSVWNFHVWNDVWMARPDLPSGMGGWQAVDGTPQEESGGAYRCGPAPLQAIKEGRVDLAHDTKFVFAEVNADRVSWRKMRNGELRAFAVEKDTVGLAILTKKPNVNQIENITDQYKYKEGSLLERASMRNAMKKVRNPIIQTQPTDFRFSADVPFNVNGDEEIMVKVNADNNGHRALNVVTNVIAHVVRYNGVKLKTLEKRTQEKEVPQDEDRTFKFKFEMSEFSEFYDEDISIRFAITARCKETEQVYVSQKICNIQKSELQVQLVSGQQEVHDGDTIKVKMTIPKPPAGKKYTKATLLIDCPIPHQTLPLMVERDMHMVTDAEVASGVVEKEFKIGHMSRSRMCDFSVTFNSEELSGIHGSMELNYKASSAPPPPPNYDDCNEWTGSWSIIGGSINWDSWLNF